jgi:hypothetical protein
MSRRAWLVALVALSYASPALSQQDSLLRAAVLLSTEGRGDSARAVVRRVLAITPPGDSLYPEALYTLGVVSGDADEATQALRRVAIEFGLSAWADEATLRLIQLNYAAGDPASALGWQDRFERDHFSSPLRAEALYWGARAHFDLRDEPAGCALLDAGTQADTTDIELQNRFAFYRQRCSEPTDSVPAATSRQSYFSVQVIAVKSIAAADETLSKLSEAGFEAAVVRDRDGLIKVRVGRYRTRAQASETARQIRSRLGGEAFVVEVTP